MTDYSRNLKHIIIQQSGLAEDFTPSTGGSGKYSFPSRNRDTHSQNLEKQLSDAIEKRKRVLQANPSIKDDNSGFYLEFNLKKSASTFLALEKLENRQGKNPIELRAVREAGGDVFATVFVPDKREDFFQKKVNDYAQIEKDSLKGNPANEKLVAQIESVSYANVRSIFTGDIAELPPTSQEVWWEVWLVPQASDDFVSSIASLEITVSEKTLKFPEREVVLAYSSIEELDTAMNSMPYLAELRLYKESPYTFMAMPPREQIDYSADLKERTIIQNVNSVYVCILDTGITKTHPLIDEHLDLNHCHTQFLGGTGGQIDRIGHGTLLAGLSLYGDLTEPLQSSSSIVISHGLEASKILPDTGVNPPKLYGRITKDGVYDAEISNPEARRVLCLAVSDPDTKNDGKPTSWSAAIDQLAFEDDETQRLIVVSAGNIRKTPHNAIDYLAENDTSGIESPGQAWNVITVGAISTKTILSDPSFRGWSALAQVGGLCPTSRTSVIWEDQWPIKPEVVFEGGNKAVSSSGVLDFTDDLSLLSTYHEPLTRPLHTVGETSAATALASRFAAQIIAKYPDLWPETVRALIIHSAEWNQTMLRSVSSKSVQRFTLHEKRSLLRRYGYGVPNLQRALNSAKNDLTLIAEGSLLPYEKGSSNIKAKEMNLHRFPWPQELLNSIGDSNVKMRVTLSYFIEPNPGERGWIKKHSYASHNLKFEVKRSLETEEAFRKRINKSAREEGEEINSVQSDTWIFTSFRKGSIFSDVWEGTASALASKDAIAVFPTGGWWKEKRHLESWKRRVRYSLVVSLILPEVDVDIYTPINEAVQIEDEVLVDVTIADN